MVVVRELSGESGCGIHRCMHGFRWVVGENVLCKLRLRVSVPHQLHRPTYFENTEIAEMH